jgi:hypothetical protein
MLKYLLDKASKLLMCVDSRVRWPFVDIIVRQYLMFMAVSIMDRRNS